MRLRLLVAAAVVAVLAAPGAARPAAQTLAPPHLYRPNPVFTSIPLDYVKPLPTPSGGVAMMPPLSEKAVAASVLDLERLHYRLLDDLGGFLPAPLGSLALSSGGHAIVGSAKGKAQIPLYQHHDGGKVNAFTFIGGGGPTGPPDNGKKSVPGLGVPIAVPRARNNNNVPPANQGFSGNGSKAGTKGHKGGGATNNGHGGGAHTNPGTSTGTGKPGGPHGRTTTARTTTRARTTTTRQTTTQATVSTTTPTTTTEPTTTRGGGGGGGGGGGDTGDCGGDGISIQSDPSNPNGCIMKLFNAAPGDEEHEVLTITNASNSTYRLALKVSGVRNHLWTDLHMGVWVNGTPTPNPLPPLLFWTTQYNDLVTLAPGESIKYRIELFLPVEAGNVDQSLTAVIDFNWEGH